MRYWWVNQKQTFKEEFKGGYLWSPKRKTNGARNQFYENMREVSPGDRVFSFVKSEIVAIGIATSNCFDAPKPSELEGKGDNWDTSGWMVKVSYNQMRSPIRPKEFIQKLRPVLPEKYSPLQWNGKGNQSVYLAELPNDFVRVLEGLLTTNGNALPKESPLDAQVSSDSPVTNLEDYLEDEIHKSEDIEETEKEQLVKARRGQGRFRENVLKVEASCRVTSVSDQQFLIASHIKPWRSSTNFERLDGENGLMLTPTVDYLFDRGFISFTDDGQLLVSPIVAPITLRKLGIPLDSPINSGKFTSCQKKYLSYHRQNIYLESGRDN